MNENVVAATLGIMISLLDNCIWKHSWSSRWVIAVALNVVGDRSSFFNCTFCDTICREWSSIIPQLCDFWNDQLHLQPTLIQCEDVESRTKELCDSRSLQNLNGSSELLNHLIRCWTHTLSINREGLLGKAVEAIFKGSLHQQLYGWLYSSMGTLFGTQWTQTPRTLTSRSLATLDLGPMLHQEWNEQNVLSPKMNSLLNYGLRVALVAFY